MGQNNFIKLDPKGLTKTGQSRVRNMVRWLNKKKSFDWVTAGALNVAIQLGNDKRTSQLGESLLEGLHNGTNQTKHEEYPVCPNCGQRHP